MNASPVLTTLADGIFTITLNRPQSRNALDTASCEALGAAALTARADESVRLVLVRAAGPVFCAGADLKERQGMGPDAIRVRRLKAFSTYAALETLPMPTIAVVEGPAIGSGCEIAAACDLIIATDAASFATPEALWGTIGATQRLPRILGKRLAKDMMFTGRRLSADEARAAGLVARVVPAERLDEIIAEIATTIRKAPPAALRQAKCCIDQGAELDPRGALATELMAIEENLAADTWRNGIACFGDER